MARIRICFVCLGNICRSPTAEGIMRARIQEAGLQAVIAVDSAGVESYHVGERADPRARETASHRGVQLESRGRHFKARDLERFDYVLAMDRENHEALSALAPDEELAQKIYYLREFEPGSASRSGGLDVPDPYYGGDDGFERVFDICDASCRGLLAFLSEEHRLP